MKTLKIDERTHHNLMAAKFIFDCKSAAELINKAIAEMYENHGLLVAEIMSNDK